MSSISLHNLGWLDLYLGLVTRALLAEATHFSCRLLCDRALPLIGLRIVFYLHSAVCYKYIEHPIPIYSVSFLFSCLFHLILYLPLLLLPKSILSVEFATLLSGVTNCKDVGITETYHCCSLTNWCSGKHFTSQLPIRGHNIQRVGLALHAMLCTSHCPYHCWCTYDRLFITRST